ncbi:ADP,ATP carrier protein 1 [Dictyocoela muelleri]|nr:ADP,ATP carrier protein 1 [Dictyocoela muelleri]
MEKRETQFSERLPTEEEVERIAEENKKLFGAIRIAPIEKKKLWAMTFIFTSIILIYSIAREFKDVFTMDRQSVATIYAIKTFIMPIVAIIATMAVQSLLTRFSNKKILHYTLFAYGIYFIIYGAILFPFRDYIEMGQLKLLDLFSDDQFGYKGGNILIVPLGIIFRWTSSLHFIMSEIWGSIVFSVMFMSFAADVCPVGQFSRFMPIFIIFSNLGLILSAFLILGYSHAKLNWSYHAGNWLIIGIFIFFGILCLTSYFVMSWLDKAILSKPLYIVKNVQKKKKKQKVSFSEGIKVITTSKFALAMCLLVLSYNMMVNMTEANQKSCINVYAKNKNKDIGSHFLGLQFYNQLITGVLVICFLLSPLQRMIQNYGWLSMAIIPPVFASVATGVLLIMAFINTSADGNCSIPYLGYIGESLKWAFPFITIDLEQYLATITVTLYKVMKYGPFDISKETIGRRIDGEYRPRLKGVYDGLCGKFGKSLGSLLSFIIFTCLGRDSDVRQASPIYLLITTVLSVGWFLSVFYLNSKYAESVEKNTTVDLDIINQPSKVEAN